MRTLPLALLTLLACDRLDNFDVNVSGQTKVQGSPLGALLSSFPQADAFTRFDVSESTQFKNQNVDPDKVDTVVLEKLTLRVVSPAGQDLSFFGTVIFSLETEGLPKKEIARRSGFPAGQTSVDFTVVPDDLKAYLLAKQATLVTDLMSSKQPNQDTTLELSATFDVDVAVENLL